MEVIPRKPHGSPMHFTGVQSKSHGSRRQVVFKSCLFLLSERLERVTTLFQCSTPVGVPNGGAVDTVGEG